MIPIPKPKFFERKVPTGQSEDDYFDEIIARQTHILRDAIDRVSSIHKCNNLLSPKRFRECNIGFVKILLPIV